MFRNLITAFQDNFRCIAPDHLGMGLSARPLPGTREYRLDERIVDFSAFLGKLQLSYPIHLLLHDWGGPIGLGWAVHNPEKVASIVLMNTATRWPQGYRLPWSLAIFRKCPLWGNILIKEIGLFTQGLVRRATLRPLKPYVREGYLAPYQKPCHRRAIASFVKDIPLTESHPSHFILSHVDDGLSRLQNIPILIIWGLLDFVFTRLFLEDFKQRLPRAKVLALPRAGHWALEDEPSQIIQGLKTFFHVK
jgi:haloalkane dehalogenase